MQHSWSLPKRLLTDSSNTYVTTLSSGACTCLKVCKAKTPETHSYDIELLHPKTKLMVDQSLQVCFLTPTNYLINFNPDLCPTCSKAMYNIYKTSRRQSCKGRKSQQMHLCVMHLCVNAYMWNDNLHSL